MTNQPSKMTNIAESFSGEEDHRTFGLRMVLLSCVILLISVALLVYSQNGAQESANDNVFGERRPPTLSYQFGNTTSRDLAVESRNRSTVGGFGNSGFSVSVNKAVTNPVRGDSKAASQNPELARQIRSCAGAGNPLRCQAIQVTKEFLLADLHRYSVEFLSIHFHRAQDGTPTVCGLFRILNSDLATPRPFVSTKLSGYPVISGVDYDRRATSSDSPLKSDKEQELSQHSCFKF